MIFNGFIGNISLLMQKVQNYSFLLMGRKEMKKLWFGLLATLLLTVFVVPAFAWEFAMTGQFEWRYRYFGRANGYQDLFGNMTFEDSPLNTTGQLIGFAGPNFYRGYNGQAFNASGVGAAIPMSTGFGGNQVKIVKGGFSFADADAYANDQRMTLDPIIRVNNAIRFFMNIDLAGIRHKYNHRDFETNGPLDRWYQFRVSGNAFDTAMIPSINQLRLAVEMPWGIMSIGAKPFPFGTGALLGYNTRADSLLYYIPYGPFRLVPGLWLARSPDGFGAFLPYPNVAPTAYGGPAANSVCNYDGGQHHTIFWTMVGYYQCGPIEIGGGITQELNHSNMANLGGNGLTGSRFTYPNGPYGGETTWTYGGRDLAFILYEIYMKYNNGRFFANAEYNWVNYDNYYLGAGTGSANSGAPQLYSEYANFFAEAGALYDPARLAFLFAWSGGPALNNGNPTKAYGGLAINNQATDAYNYLMFHTYGGGNNAPWAAGLTFTNDDNGQIVDTYALAARLDYAVAANLNIWGSYMWASRVEQNGFYAGGVNYNGVGGNASVIAAQNWKAAAMPGAGAAANMNPYVDDRYLGWEANLGVDWKWLENFRVVSCYSYWQPGPWFDQAYAVVGLANGTPAPTLAGPLAVGAYM